MKDIANRDDIDQLMLHFYGRALSDDVIGYIFSDIAKLDLDHHLPIIGDFWETILFQTNSYSKHGRNPMQVHGDLSLKEPLLLHHFERWLEIFTATVNETFAGDNAEFIKLRAKAIANRMLEHVSHVSTRETMLENAREAGRLS